MEKTRKRLAYGLIGASGGVAGLAGPASLCGGGGCSACLRCAGFGIALVVMALWNRKGDRGRTADRDDGWRS